MLHPHGGSCLTASASKPLACIGSVIRSMLICFLFMSQDGEDPKTQLINGRWCFYMVEEL